MTKNASTCPLSGGRTLHSALLDGTQQPCARRVLDDVASATLGVVATFSAGGKSMSKTDPFTGSRYAQLDADWHRPQGGSKHGDGETTCICAEDSRFVKDDPPNGLCAPPKPQGHSRRRDEDVRVCVRACRARVTVAVVR